MAVRVRVTNRNDRAYVSVVYDKTKDGDRTTRTLESFGQLEPESLVRAHHFKANCEELIRLVRDNKIREPNVALAVFGQTLGADIVLDLMREFRGDPSEDHLRALLA